MTAVAIVLPEAVDPGLRRRIEAGQHPQQDFFALSDALGAALVTPGGRHEFLAGKASALARAAWNAFSQRQDIDVFISSVDRLGLMLAAMLKAGRAPNRHIVICHGKIARPQDLWALKALGLHTHIDRFVCYGPAMAQRLVEALRLPADRVVTIRHAVDHRFWRPQDVAPERLIVSAGMLHRDYPTLIEAVRSLDVNLAIAAFSPWVAKQSIGVAPEALPANVAITRCSYSGLGQLYARALFIAVPVDNRYSQAGSLVVYEAMAMGKAVVVTRTHGQHALSVVRDGETGYYVAPGDVRGWRERIEHLLAHPEEAIAMGQRARAAVEAGLNMDTYVQEMAGLVRAVAGESRGVPAASTGLPPGH